MATEYFEYLVHSSEVVLDAEALNVWGSSGWELIAIVRDENEETLHYYFKRRHYVN